ncbi:unnamed protein product [Hymenolepis diminuta]|uniref:Uncharacterized protein n=1 Tax=Hymenolepis diminuta TaxID=6216 RepID=A0A564Y229_HYMDI|nr:unnamed protein product [Hymenolepis diminuta]
MLSRSLTQVTHIKLSLFFTQEQRTPVSCRLLRFLLISSLPRHAPSPIFLCHSYRTRCGSFEYSFWPNQLLVL